MRMKVKNVVKNRFIVQTVVIMMMTTVIQGCSVFMAAKQPPKKNMDVLHAGTSRASVIAEFGSPVHTETNAEGNHVDIFSFVQGYSKGVKASRAVFHGTADIFTLGLWEVIGTPVEAVADGTQVKVQVAYDKDDRVADVTTLDK